MQAQQTAGRLGKPEISSLDVLVAVLEQEGGILSPILRKASCDPGLLLQAAQREVSHEPTQSGATTQDVYKRQDGNPVLLRFPGRA